MKLLFVSCVQKKSCGPTSGSATKNANEVKPFKRNNRSMFFGLIEKSLC